ncbi:MAG: tetratricopeptide repeat protein [Deltaproteobacteria bacterium]|nr:tetratricopeptide repeat protein [Deltaproteobacteria bacterium]
MLLKRNNSLFSKFVLLFGLVLSFSISHAQEQDKKEAEKQWREILEEGEELFRLGEFEKALEVYQNAVVLTPNHPSPHMGLQEIYFATGDYDRAVVEIIILLNLYPDLPLKDYKIRSSWGDWSAYQRRMDELAQLTQQTDNDALRLLLGYNYYFGNEKSKAIREFLKVRKGTEAYWTAQKFLIAYYEDRVARWREEYSPLRKGFDIQLGYVRSWDDISDIRFGFYDEGITSLDAVSLEDVTIPTSLLDDRVESNGVAIDMLYSWEKYHGIFGFQINGLGASGDSIDFTDADIPNASLTTNDLTLLNMYLGVGRHWLIDRFNLVPYVENRFTLQLLNFELEARGDTRGSATFQSTEFSDILVVGAKYFFYRSLYLNSSFQYGFWGTEPMMFTVDLGVRVPENDRYHGGFWYWPIFIPW